MITLQELVGKSVVNRHRSNKARVGVIVNAYDNGEKCHPTVLVKWPDYIAPIEMVWYDLALAETSENLKDIVIDYSL